jgi:hypothetical protein
MRDFARVNQLTVRINVIKHLMNEADTIEDCKYLLGLLGKARWELECLDPNGQEKIENANFILNN